MYGPHFGLASAPFRITPDTRRFYPGAQRGAVLDALCYAVEQGEGIIKLSGEVGSGKTMLCRMLADRLEARADVIYLANPSLQRDDVIRVIAQELKLPLDGDRLCYLQRLQQYLLQRHAQGRRVVVFVEEAQCMDMGTLEEIRLLSNLETREEKLLQIVLFGQPELEQRLALHEVRQLRDRITHSFTLEALNLADIRDYIPFRLRAAGYQGGDPFTPSAYRLLSRASAGLIRRIHILADKALLAAYAEGHRQVNARHMKRAIADSEFATPWPGLRPFGWSLAASLAVLAVTVLLYQQSIPVMENIDTGVRAENSPPKAAIAVMNHPASLTPAAGTTKDTPVQHLTANQDVVDQRLSATRQLLAKDTRGYFTIQVMTSDDESRHPLERLLQDARLQAHLPQLYLAPTLVKGTARWSVFYGRYNRFDDAEQALDEIPAMLKKRGPYLRSLNAVMKEATGQWMLAQQDT